MKTILEYKNWADLNEHLSELTKSGKQKKPINVQKSYLVSLKDLIVI